MYFYSGTILTSCFRNVLDEKNLLPTPSLSNIGKWQEREGKKRKQENPPKQPCDLSSEQLNIRGFRWFARKTLWVQLHLEHFQLSRSVQMLS